MQVIWRTSLHLKSSQATEDDLLTLSKIKHMKSWLLNIWTWVLLIRRRSYFLSSSPAACHCWFPHGNNELRLPIAGHIMLKQGYGKVQAATLCCLLLGKYWRTHTSRRFMQICRLQLTNSLGSPSGRYYTKSADCNELHWVAFKLTVLNPDFSALKGSSPWAGVLSHRRDLADPHNPKWSQCLLQDRWWPLQPCLKCPQHKGLSDFPCPNNQTQRGMWIGRSMQMMRLCSWCW